MNNTLDIAITPASVLKYALPTVLSTVFLNLYGLVDSLFVSNLIGTDGLSAINIVGPILTVTLALGTMVAAGGSALVAAQIGSGDAQRGRENFSFFVAFCMIVSIALLLAGLAFRQPLLRAMGADDTLYPLCEAYTVPIMILIPFIMTSMLLTVFMATAGRPSLGFIMSICGGLTNMFLDYLLIAVIPLGIAGAAYATGAGYLLQSVIGLLYFIFNRKSELHFVKPKPDWKALGKACSNGMSEMVTMLAITVTMVVMNVILMRVGGSDAVAAASVVMMTQMLLSSMYTGYSQGIAPLISFGYGRQDSGRLRKLFRIALGTIGVMAASTFVLAFPLARPIALLFTAENEAVVRMAVDGIHTFSVAFLCMGFNVFASGMFTALNDGVTSAILSFFRTFVFLIAPLLLLPRLLGVDGVWIALPTAEILSLLLTVYFLRKKRTVYGYAV